MHSELFSIFGITIQMYGLMMAIGFATCYFLLHRLARLTDRNPREIDTIVMISAICGVIGARIVYVCQNWKTEFADNPLLAFELWKGGLVFYGGLILALAGLAVYARHKGEKIRSLFDFCAVLLPLGHAFGRVGCFFHGCCFGGTCDSPIGVRFPRLSPAWIHQVREALISPYSTQALPVWPTQLFEAAGCLVLTAGLWICYRKANRFPGLTCGIYAIGYAVLRFVIECFRDDPRGATVLGLTFSQMISIGLIGLGAAFILVSQKERVNGPVNS